MNKLKKITNRFLIAFISFTLMYILILLIEWLVHREVHKVLFMKDMWYTLLNTLFFYIPVGFISFLFGRYILGVANIISIILGFSITEIINNWYRNSSDIKVSFVFTLYLVIIFCAVGGVIETVLYFKKNNK